MNAHTPLKSTLLIGAAALLCAGLQLAGIDTLAAARSASLGEQVVQLPMVLVTGERESGAIAVQQLPQVVVVGRRSDLEATTARVQAGMADPAS